MSRTGRWLLLARGDEIDLVDLLGAMPTRVLPAIDGPVELVGRCVWGLHGNALTRIAPEDLRVLPTHAIVPGRPTGLVAGVGAACSDALATGTPPCRVSVRDDALFVEPIEQLADGEAIVALHGRRMIAARPGAIRAIDHGRGEAWKLGHLDGEVAAAAVLFSGRVLALLVRRAASDVITVLLGNGTRIHQIAVPRVVRWAVAEELGHAFVLGPDQSLARIDLRYGRMITCGRAPIAITELVVDQDGRHAVLLGADDEVVHVSTSELVRPAPASHAPAMDTTAGGSAEDPAPADDRPAAGDRAPAADEASGDSRPLPIGVAIDVVEPAAPLDARSVAPVVEPAEPRRPVIIPDDLPLAFGPPPPRTADAAPAGSPYPSARAHLDALLDIVAARTAVAIADAWNSGRLSPTHATQRPHELEVEALLGGSGSFAPHKLTETKARLVERQDEASARAHASAAQGIRLPFPSLARELRLSGVAAQILLVVAAPALRGEIARLFGVLSNDPARPMVDRFLIEQIIAGDRSTLRDQIARELASDAPLVRHGVIEVEAGPVSLFTRLSVSDALLDRLRGVAPVRVDNAAVVRAADVPLEALVIAPEVKRALVLALATPPPDHAPLRLVLRGRRGSGRHSVVAALAARVEREIVAIDTARFSRGRRELIAALRGALFRASMHGLIPVLSGLEQLEPTETDLRDAVCQVLRQHPGPLVVRTSPEGNLPLDPGFVSTTLPALLETERAAAWADALGAARLRADSDLLAARYRIGPGVIRKVVGALAGRPEGWPGFDDATAVLDELARQHVAARLDHVARRVDRMAHWEEVALPEELLDSLREFIGRARHRRTVYERWGYDAKLTSARGLTALFYGPPGTGKTMVAGVIAQELGLDMYRVDLARVVSKWVGETEKNLAEVFDAAEEGQVLILFDEADSLFAKRTDVRTSNDRYANLEVNYLLQRLDTFEGVAILTSNLDGAIDPAFKRRMSLRLQFPFPDEETRLQLWASHVTPETPTLGELDFPELARRFPLSGGYIRNCALRAAFLAAHEGRPMRQEHLLRAVQLEYREMGKLSTSSRLE
ncbi:MAG TPA: AAA family ATPase [Kofleriaceae bacterium]|nr:AAA family ATPase [Kofleriaceae bacterium]